MTRRTTPVTTHSEPMTSRLAFVRRTNSRSASIDAHSMALPGPRSAAVRDEISNRSWDTSLDGYAKDSAPFITGPTVCVDEGRELSGRRRIAPREISLVVVHIYV